MDTRTPRTVLLVPERWEVVDAFRAKYQLKSTSAAVAQIINEWMAFCREKVNDTE